MALSESRIVFNKIQIVTATMRDKAEKAITKACFDIEAKAKVNATGRPGPEVISGNLRGSIRAIPPSGARGWVGRSGLTASSGELEGEVVVGADYGLYIEKGTARHPAYPFFQPAIDEVEPQFIAAMKEIARYYGPAGGAG